MKTINNDLIRSFNPCYDPSEKKIPDGETLPVLEWVEKYRPAVPPQDIIWLLCRNEFLSDRDLRLFAVWCAREALSLIDSPYSLGVAACDVAERFVNGEASREELAATRAAAYAATRATYAANRAARAADADATPDAAADAARAAADAATDAAAYAATDAAAYAARAAYAAADAAGRGAREEQLVKLLTYFK